MVASNLLKAKILEFNLSKSEIAKELGISTTSLNYKLNNKTEFKATEIVKLSNLLGISREKDKYFFV